MLPGRVHHQDVTENFAAAHQPSRATRCTASWSIEAATGKIWQPGCGDSGSSHAAPEAPRPARASPEREGLPRPRRLRGLASDLGGGQPGLDRAVPRQGERACAARRAPAFDAPLAPTEDLHAGRDPDLDPVAEPVTHARRRRRSPRRPRAPAHAGPHAGADGHAVPTPSRRAPRARRPSPRRRPPRADRAASSARAGAPPGIRGSSGAGPRSPRRGRSAPRPAPASSASSR